MRKQAIGVLVALVFQYLLGMWSNLFVQFPEMGDQGRFWEFAWKQLPLALHIILGLLLLVGSSALIAQALKSKDKTWIKVSIVGFLAILLSAYSGSTFISTQNDLYSLIMSAGFI